MLAVRKPVSTGNTVWQASQGMPVCRAKLGTATADCVENSSAPASAEKTSPPSALRAAAVLMNIAELLMYEVSTARRFHFFRKELPPSPLRPLTEPLAWPAAPRIKRLGRQPSTGMLVLTLAHPACCRAGVFQAFA